VADEPRELRADRADAAVGEPGAQPHDDEGVAGVREEPGEPLLGRTLAPLTSCATKFLFVSDGSPM